MNGLANRKKALTVLLAVMATVCLAVALALALPAERAFAQDGNDGEGTAERTPVVTYVIGDTTVTSESGFTFDEATNTYTYANHAAGWSAAVAKSAELYDTDNENANLVKVQIASDWIAADNENSTSFGTGDGFASEGALQVMANANILLDLNGNDINRNLYNAEDDTQSKAAVKNGSVFIILKNASLEINDSTAHTTDDSYISGTIKGGSTTGNGGGIWNNGGTLILNSGSVSYNYNAGSNGAGIANVNGTLIMNGGRLAYNTLNKTSSYGLAGGLYNAGTGVAKITAGEIVYNTANTNSSNRGGGGIYNGSGALLEISGGYVGKNHTSNDGGGILNNGGNLFLTGDAKITDNTLNKTDSYSKNIYNMSGTVSVDGTPEFEIRLSSTSTLNITGALFNENTGNYANITVYKQNYEGSFTTNYAQYNIKDGIMLDPAMFFKPLHSTYAVALAEVESNACEVVAIPVASANFSFKADYVSDNSSASTERLAQYDGENIASQGVYGANFSYTYGGQYEAVYSFAAGSAGSEQTATGVERIRDDSWQSSNGLVNAGTYKITYTVSSYNIVFFIVITPIDLSDGKGSVADNVQYSLNTNSWEKDQETNEYIGVYNGISKTSPAASVTLNSASLVSGTDYVISYLLNGESVTELKEVGTYTVVIQGTGNYTGTVYAAELFVITPDDTKSYAITWQYYDGTEWKDLSSIDNAAFTYTSADYSGYVRVVLTVEGVETRYAYASGVTEYNLGTDEDINDVTHGLIVGIAKDTENKIVNTGEYALSMQGTPNYTVAESDKSSAVTVAKYNLANIVSGGNDAANISASLSTTVYDGEAKTLSLSASVTLNGNTVVLGTAGTEYEYAVKYINGDGTETEVSSFILGGTYKIYIVAKDNQNFTGTLGVAGTVTIDKAINSVTLTGTGNWEYGTYNINIHGFNGSAAWLYDGTIDGTEQAYLYYTVKNTDGEAVNATLTRFTSPTDEVVKALNELGAGSYTLVAEADETASYTGATRSAAFAVVKATNRWISAPEASGWVWNAYDETTDKFYSSALYGSAVYTVTDKDGNAVTDLANAQAGTYTLTATVAETENYGGLKETVTFTVSKAANAWTTNPEVKSFVAGYYDETENAVKGAAKYGEATYKITDENGDEITDLANAEVGTYTLTMTVAGTDDYEGLTYISTFSVFESRDLKGGEIAGIVVMSVIVAGLAATAVVLLIKRRKAV